ncbi:MAG: alpha/beta fold hydrolase [Candidatus Thorarchaeota archaeon]|jgi:pimeloyl-ACP methyl ester carboxylesterase
MAADRRILYYTLLILSILIASSLYLSWTVDRGLGTLDVERVGTESEPGRTVNFTVYSPREEYPGLMPVVLTIHGVGGSKETMYSFNVELARKDFTVAAIDLAGHGDSSIPFNFSDYTRMAEDCYAVLQYIGLNYNDTNPNLYGVVAHSLGVHVGLAMYNMAVQPKAIAAIGPVWLEDVVSLPGNLLIAVGEFDELIPRGRPLDTLRTLTGFPNAMAGITYGGFDGDAAYRLTIAPTNHVGEATDMVIVAESVSWMLQALHNIEEPDLGGIQAQLIYPRKTVAYLVGAASLLLSLIPLLLISVTLLPEQIRPRYLSSEAEPMTFVGEGMLGSVLSAMFVLVYLLTGLAGITLESMGMRLSPSILGTGLVLFFLMCPVLWIATMMLVGGKQRTFQSLLALGYRKGDIRSLLLTVARAIIPALICVGWLLMWVALGGMPGTMDPVTVLPLFRFPTDERMLSILTMTCLALPFSMSDALWTRGLLLSERDWGGRIPYARRFVSVFGMRMVPTLAFAAVLILGSSALGFVTAPVVLLGLLLAHFVIASAIVSLLIIIISVEHGNPWPAVIIGAFLYGWILIGTVPLV